MGQYYQAVILKRNDKLNVESFAYSHDYSNGLKLMQHSWIGNPFVARIEQEILNNPKRIVWAGDYAEADKNEYDEFYHKDSDGDGKNLYTLCDDELKLSRLDCKRIAKYRYLVNHDKKEFVDLYTRKLPISDTYTTNKGKVIKYIVHPLPLLTSEGNGLGGGDYRSSNGGQYIGTWARDLISLETIKPEDFTEIQPNFTMENKMQITITIEKAFTISGLPENLTKEKLDEYAEIFGMNVVCDCLNELGEVIEIDDSNAMITETTELALNWAITTEERESNV